MAQNVIINGVTYANVPEVDIPKSSGGTAKFYDTASADATAANILTGKTAFGASGSISGDGCQLFRGAGGEAAKDRRRHGAV